MADPEVRGNCLIGTYQFIRANYTGDKLERILGSVPTEMVNAWKDAGEREWYPSAYFSEGLRAVAEAHADDQAMAQKQVVGVGRQISAGSIAGFMKLVMRFMTPRLLATKLPEFFARDFRNTRAYVKCDITQLSKNVMICHFLEMKQHPYVPCAAQGWVYNGLEAMGCKDVKCHDLDSDWNCNDGTFRVTWT